MDHLYLMLSLVKPQSDNQPPRFLLRKKHSLAVSEAALVGEVVVADELRVRLSQLVETLSGRWG